MFGGSQNPKGFLTGISGTDGQVLTKDSTQPKGMRWAAGGGGGITALTGDVTASGTGSVPATIANAPARRYVDFANGSDTTGTGTITKPWKTLTHAYAQITDASVSYPYTIFLSGGNNDSDGAITAKPNVNLFAEYPIQITPAFTISGTSGNDTANFMNIIFIGGFNWTRNDATFCTLGLVNCSFSGSTVMKQQNATGSMGVLAFNTGFFNSQIECQAGGFLAQNCQFLGTTAFVDMSNAAYAEILAGYVGGAMTINGGTLMYFSGVQFDVPFGASLTCVSTTNGQPTIQTDSGSIPASVTGPFTLVAQSNSQYENYTPATAGNWSPVPSKVNGALDTLAAKLATPYQYNQIRFVDGVKGADTNSGSPTAPFKTIQAALTSLGDSASAADVKKPISVYIQGGAYDEALTIPLGRICNLIAMGTVILGDGTQANWGSTTPRSVTFTIDATKLFGSDIKPALNIYGLPGSDATSTFIMESGCFRISGNLNVTGDGTTNTLNLHSVRVDGTVTHTTAALTNWQCYRTLIVGAVTTTGNLVLERAYDSRFNALVSVNAYNMTMNCNFLAGMTVQSIQQNLLPNGMFCTNFTGTFTGPANSLRLDAQSNYYFVSNGATLAGGATKVMIGLQLSGTTSARPSGTLPAGSQYFDTALTKPIWAKGDGTWVDATGTAV